MNGRSLRASINETEVGTLQEPQTAEPLRPLPDDALETRSRQLPKAPLTHVAIKRMSLAGAQHKLAVVLQNDALFEPAGATPSTHIMKPDHPDEDYPHSVINEWFVMRLAKRLGACRTWDRRLQIDRSGPFFTGFLSHSCAMGLQIRQKLSSLGSILASPLFENAFGVPSPTGS